MSFRSTGLGLLLALAAGCGQAPPAASPPDRETRADATTRGSLAKPQPPTPLTSETTPAAPAPPPPPPPGEGAAPDKDDKNTPPKTAKEPLTEEGPRAATAAATFNGSMTQTEIRDVMLKNGDVFDDCYKIGAGKSRQFVATVTVKATVGPTGNVNASEILKSTSKNKQVDTCVAEAFKKMKFPRPKGGATSVITFPIDFNGVEQIQ